MSLLKEKIELTLEEAELKLQASFVTVPRWVKYTAAACLLAAIPAFYLSRALSAQVAKSKYNSLALKAKQSFVAPKSLTVGEPYLTTIGNGVYAAAFLVVNENVDLGLAGVPYEIQALDKNGSVVASQKDEFYILPNQKKYAAAARLKTEVPTEKARIIFPKTLPWKRNLNAPAVNLITPAPTLYSQTNPVALVAKGLVENKTPYALREVTLVFLVNNPAGDVVAISQRKEYTLKPFERRAFEQQWPGVYSPEALTGRIFAYTNTLDESNVRASPQTPAPSLQR